MTGTIEVLADAEAVCRRAAEGFVRSAEAAVGARGRFAVALSGGHTPRRLYALLADPAGPYRAGIAWDRTHVFWGDERCVPPDSADSNYRMAYEALLAHVPVPAAQIHRMPVEQPDGAGAYARTLRAFFGAQPPRFDLVLLGLGPEGHTASLFPGSPALTEATRWVVPVEVEQAVRHRITLTPPVLNAAGQVTFLACGAEKAEALRGVLGAERRPSHWPAQIVQPADGALLWLLDREAARLLPSHRS